MILIALTSVDGLQVQLARKPTHTQKFLCADSLTKGFLLKRISNQVLDNLEIVSKRMNSSNSEKEVKLYAFNIGMEKYVFKLVNGKDGYVVLQSTSFIGDIREELVERASFLLNKKTIDEQTKSLAIGTAIQSLAEPINSIESVNRMKVSLRLQEAGFNLVNRIVDLPREAKALGVPVGYDDFFAYQQHMQEKPKSEINLLEQAVDLEEAKGKRLYALMGRNKINFFAALAT